ncbi:unnamed protein product [Chondrus crispus]|uniref:Uncharacterized protein n=1 Tax=Chondrus crispus TaxID=2769 RepID=R7Q4K0_CHOCR|nr:unnamed protein product [Chondrus crispus]CDF33447.1 unnamed protein product [Chondrus crispus]|eukprot:XP_005713250.1 unnamed protein product [Chondrus crispus]
MSLRLLVACSYQLLVPVEASSTMRTKSKGEELPTNKYNLCAGRRCEPRRALYVHFSAPDHE